MLIVKDYILQLFNFNDIDSITEMLMFHGIDIEILIDVWRNIIGASLSEPHPMGSTVKSVFLLACLLVPSKYLYMAESRLSANQHYIKHYKHYIKHVEC